MSDEPLPRPPVELERRVRHTLRERGLIRPWIPVTPLLLSLVLGAALFGAGYLAGGGREPALPAGDRYALLLYEDETFQPAAAEADLVREYAAWARDLRAEERLDLGEKLADDLRIAGPQVDRGAARVTGMFIIRAPTWDAALEIARRCPHVRHGGTVEIRAIVPT